MVLNFFCVQQNFFQKFLVFYIIKLREVDFNSYFINVLRFIFFTILDNALKIFLECVAKAVLVIRVWLQKLQAIHCIFQSFLIDYKNANVP